jgi:hypothetical protein
MVTRTLLNVSLYVRCLCCYELSIQLIAQAKFHTTDTLEIFQYLICPL